MLGPRIDQDVDNGDDADDNDDDDDDDDDGADDDDDDNDDDGEAEDGIHAVPFSRGDHSAIICASR